MTEIATQKPALPRVAITYCTQCKWMLRAGYFGQELLSTFGTTIGEIALIPATGGLFSVVLTYLPTQAAGVEGEVEVKSVLLWDRKAEGGFPETKILKQRVRDHLDPKRDLGHSDTPSKQQTGRDTAPTSATVTRTDVPSTAEPAPSTKLNPDGTVCEDCN